MSRRYLVTGAAGQDGGYLVERLVAEGAEVHGTVRDAAEAGPLQAQVPGLTVHVADIGDRDRVAGLIAQIEPNRVVNLAGNTSVARSWDFPAEAAEVLGVAPVRIMEELRLLADRTGEDVRFLQASSAEIFGDATQIPQTEQTPLAPVTPYGAAKAFAHRMTGMYRARGMHASTAILYNHESPRRPEAFVARKIAKAVVAIAAGRQETLSLGNMDAERDWGYAPDYVDAMVRILEQPAGSDFIVATGQSHSVREFVAKAFEHAGVADWESRVVVDPSLYRPADPARLVGDPAKLRSIGWRTSVDFDELVRIMVGVEQEHLAASGESPAPR